MIKDVFKEWKVIRTNVNILFSFVKSNNEDVLLWFIENKNGIYEINNKNNIKIHLKKLNYVTKCSIFSYLNLTYHKKVIFIKLRLSLLFFLNRNTIYNIVLFDTIKNGKYKLEQSMSMYTAICLLNTAYSMYELDGI